jgi:hypothetical protein
MAEAGARHALDDRSLERFALTRQMANRLNTIPLPNSPWKGEE